jgi:hypothetical protein
MIIVDAEQAALIEVALSMLEGALTARVARADPDAVISNSLHLQANKLATVRAHLRMPEPPPWELLPDGVQNALLGSMSILQGDHATQAKNVAYERLRGFVYAAAIPATTPA